MKSKELVEILDYVFESAQEPDWQLILKWCGFAENPIGLAGEIMHLLWLCAEDQAAFDEAIWRLTNDKLME